MRRAALLTLLLAGTLAARTRAQDGPAVAVRPVPSRPAKGSVAWLLLTPTGADREDSVVAVAGEAAGEPLHFRRSAEGWRALFGAPLEGPDSLELTLRIQRQGRTDSTRVALALERPALRSERLRVPPAMARFDSATSVRIDRELAQGREVSRRSHDTPPLWEGRFRVPRGSRVTSVYGTAREYNGEITSRHMGTDFAGAVGAPVRAAARGVVALVADFYLAGHAVYLDHGDGLVTGYFHLSRVDAAQGDTVAAGQVIGRVGRSGRVTGPHLHWIARYGTITVDPMSLVRLPAPP